MSEWIIGYYPAGIILVIGYLAGRIHARIKHGKGN